MTGLSPFFKYFGSKARSAVLYPEPKHETIIEPFAGSAGYALRYHERDVVLCDADPRVTIIWRYLIHSSPEDILSLPLMEPGQNIDTLDVCVEARLFLSCCVNTSPFRKTLTAWKSGQNNGLWGQVWRERVASQVESIKHWKVVHGSYAELPNVGATYFVDPPYETLQEHYRASHENPIDYKHLAQWCRSRKGQVIVCEKDGASWLPFRKLADIRAAHADRACGEAIWTNDSVSVDAEPSNPRGQISLFGT